MVSVVIPNISTPDELPSSVTVDNPSIPIDGLPVNISETNSHISASAELSLIGTTENSHANEQFSLNVNLALPPKIARIQKDNKKGRCIHCKRSKDTKIRSTCSFCNCIVCSIHSSKITVCFGCEDGLPNI